MRKNRRRVFWPALLIALLGLTAVTFVAFGKLRGSRTTKANTTQAASGRVKLKRAAYVRPGNLSPKLIWNLKAMGDRLEKPGKERLTVTATLSRADSQTEEVTAVWEFPDRLRLTTQKGNQARVITFAEDRVSALDLADQDLLETLVYGTAEHFFSTQMQGMATRRLGSRFRLDDGSSPDYSGPYYDVYKVADRVKTSAEQREQLKLYYFNSDTLLLERVAYEITRNGSVVKIEERIGDWTKQQGQQVARRVERFENGESVFVLTVQMAGLGPRVNDGAFANKRGKKPPYSNPPKEKHYGSHSFVIRTRRVSVTLRHELIANSHTLFGRAGTRFHTTTRLSARSLVCPLRHRNDKHDKRQPHA